MYYSVLEAGSAQGGGGGGIGDQTIHRSISPWFILLCICYPFILLCICYPRVGISLDALQDVIHIQSTFLEKAQGLNQYLQCFFFFFLGGGFLIIVIV